MIVTSLITKLKKMYLCMKNPVADVWNSDSTPTEDTISFGSTALRSLQGSTSQGSEDYYQPMRLPSGTENSGVLRNGYWYMASQYSLHPEGVTVALQEASSACAKLANVGIAAYSALPLGHSMSFDTKDLNHSDHEFWMEFNKPLMQGSLGCLILKSPGWQSSRGIKDEYDFFKSIDLPVVFVEYPLTESGLTKLKSVLKQEYSETL